MQQKTFSFVFFYISLLSIQTRCFRLALAKQDWSFCHSYFVFFQFSFFLFLMSFAAFLWKLSCVTKVTQAYKVDSFAMKGPIFKFLGSAVLGCRENKRMSGFKIMSSINHHL